MDETQNKKKLLENIEQHTKALYDMKPRPIISPESNVFASITKNLKKQFPNLSEQELLLKSMDIIKEQFLDAKEAITESEDGDTSMRSGKSDHVLAGEGQPDDTEEDDEGTIGDYWDSLTELVVAKMKKGKNKKK